MSARYFKSPITGAIWKFLPDGTGFVRGDVSRNQWVPSVCGIEDMADKQEIPAEEGEPKPQPTPA